MLFDRQRPAALTLAYRLRLTRKGLVWPLSLFIGSLTRYSPGLRRADAACPVVASNYRKKQNTTSVSGETELSSARTRRTIVADKSD